ncbi:type IV secretion system protein [Parablastomonas sp. CN1-191]|uniref:type IV secretion system protein n=1 Tax=Parablastomonas sp. CN1-191 TaxID=3400908 RepID=UPI003BF843FE
MRVLDNVDCQAATLGNFGFQSLAAPGSVAQGVILAALTLFVALFGYRLVLGEGLAARDLVGAVLKIGIVLTLALSWPAYRVLVYNVVIRGPAEIAASISAPGTAPRAGLSNRLQAVDAGILAATSSGTGRQTSELLAEDKASDGFRKIALDDENTYGYARLAFLVGTIAPLAFLRLAAGLLLALAPLMASLLLFDVSRGIFAGWVRGLVLACLGAVATSVALAVELDLIEPLLSDVLKLRGLGYATPSAPTELLALTLAFPLASAGLIALFGRVAFNRGWLTLPQFTYAETHEREWAALTPRQPVVAASATPTQQRAVLVSEGVATVMRHEERRLASTIGPSRPFVPRFGDPANDQIRASSRGKTSTRRTSPSRSRAAARRDQRS